MLTHLLILLSGLISGFILFQSAINAPLIFKTLDIDQARPLLRSIFPILFKVVGALGVVMVVLAWLSGAKALPLSFTLITVLFSVICALLVPATNRAADEGNQSRFQKLHHVSVILTVAVLLLNLALPFTL